MSTTTQKAPPKELFLTFKEHRVYAVEDEAINYDKIVKITRLGFASANEPKTKAFEKRRKTQLEWAYRYVWEERADGIYVSEWYDKPWRRVPNEFQPDVIQNVPLAGFRVVEYASRYSTSNKVWRIMDPRDFMLEISTENLQDLILNGSIINGVIQGKCIWHTGKILKYAK